MYSYDLMSTVMEVKFKVFRQICCVVGYEWKSIRLPGGQGGENTTKAFVADCNQCLHLTFMELTM